MSDAIRVAKQHAYDAALMGLEAVPARGGLRAGVAAPAARAVEVKAVVEQVDGGAPEFPDSLKKSALERVRAKYLADAPHAAFGYTFNKLVFGEGDPNARLMFIGEAPGADEDRTGRPFVGRAGELLNGMIKAMGLQRRDVYIANVLKVRPPNNATPTHEERAASAPYLMAQIAAVRPEVIVTLGLPASQVVLGSELTMGKLRGVWAEVAVEVEGGERLVVPVMPTYHPAFLLRAYTPENRKMVWSDLRKAMERLGLQAAAGGLRASS